MMIVSSLLYKRMWHFVIMWQCVKMGTIDRFIELLWNFFIWFKAIKVCWIMVFILILCDYQGLFSVILVEYCRNSFVYYNYDHYECQEGVWTYDEYLKLPLLLTRLIFQPRCSINAFCSHTHLFFYLKIVLVSLSNPHFLIKLSLSHRIQGMCSNK